MTGEFKFGSNKKTFFEIFYPSQLHLQAVHASHPPHTPPPPNARHLVSPASTSSLGRVFRVARHLLLTFVHRPPGADAQSHVQIGIDMPHNIRNITPFDKHHFILSGHASQSHAATHSGLQKRAASVSWPAWFQKRRRHQLPIMNQKSHRLCPASACQSKWRKGNGRHSRVP